MNMPTLLTAEPAAALVPPLDAAPRRLGDDVFQSAEEAVLVEGQGNSFLETGTPSGQVLADVSQGGRWAFAFTHAVRSHVAARPFQSALLAAAAGALAMMALRSRMRGRFSSSRSPWLR
jgi:hypothetical protein